MVARNRRPGLSVDALGTRSYKIRALRTLGSMGSAETAQGPRAKGGRVVVWALSLGMAGESAKEEGLESLGGEAAAAHGG